MPIKSILILGCILLSSPARAFDPFASLILEEKLVRPSIQASLLEFRQTLNATQSLYPSYSLFLTALSYIHQYYVRPLDLSPLIDAATKTLRSQTSVSAPQIPRLILSSALNTLDPHSHYYDQEEFNQLLKHTSGAFPGIGVTVGYDSLLRKIRILDVLPHTPAGQARLLPQDIIHQINAIDLPTLTFQEALDRLKGPEGSSLTLTIQRQGTPLFQVTLRREMITLPRYSLTILSPNSKSRIAYIRLPFFSDRLAADLKQSLRSLTKVDGLVLDLRDNPGGLFSEAIEVADLFLPQDEPILFLYTQDEKDSVVLTQSDPATDLPLAILINDQTASAAEIVSASLQDHRRALLFGTRTFGKGSIQNSIELTPDHFLHLTTGLYSRVSGPLIECLGVDPNVRFVLDRTLEFNCRQKIPPSWRPYTLSVSDICPQAQGEEDPILACALKTLSLSPEVFAPW